MSYIGTEITLHLSNWDMRNLLTIPGGEGPEEQGIDFDGTCNRYAELLSAYVEDAFPGATCIVRYAETARGAEIEQSPDDSDIENNELEDVLAAFSDIDYGNPERYIVWNT
jgi:hypothetical protein